MSEREGFEETNMVKFEQAIRAMVCARVVAMEEMKERKMKICGLVLFGKEERRGK